MDLGLLTIELPSELKVELGKRVGEGVRQGVGEGGGLGAVGRLVKAIGFEGMKGSWGFRGLGSQ